VNKALRAALHVVVEAGAAAESDDAYHVGSEDLEELHGSSADTADPALGEVRLGEAREAARQAFKSISRKGFEDDKLNDPERVLEFEIGAGALTAINGQIHAFLTILDNCEEEGTGLATQFARDRDVFSEQFFRIYGARQ
jgi:hypothetical protein